MSNPTAGTPRPIPSAAPSLGARLLAVAAVVVAGTCGGLIGFATTELQCRDDCTVLAGTVGVLSALGASVGVAVVAVLALRAMAEWDASQARERLRRDGDAQ